MIGLAAPVVSDADIALLMEIAPKGYTLIMKYSRYGPELFLSTYPKAWQDQYDGNGYQWADPVILGSAFRQGDRRWSSIGLPDPLGIKKKAAIHGLKYGAALTRKIDGQVSLLFLAREDRELTEEELLRASEWFTEYTKQFENTVELKEIYLQALWYQKEGYSVVEAAEAADIKVSTMKARLLGARKALGVRSNAAQ